MKNENFSEFTKAPVFMGFFCALMRWDEALGFSPMGKDKIKWVLAET
ncbi:MAG: hypothetical protein L6262_06550 [Weeksellaceae bacterium]|nr:hypothetical protein [Weeksellaceae bacterium]